jgi:hypothetical protein
MSFSYVYKVARLALGAATVLAKAPPAPVAPVVVNYGNGTGVNVWWPDSLVQPGDVMYLAYRAADQLYWENVIALPASPPEYVGSLDSGSTYEFSLSLSLNGNYKPSLFGDEAEATIIAAPAPEGFDAESTPAGVQLNWQPHSGLNVFAYLIERALPGGEFQFLGAVPHPISEYFNGNLQPGQLYLYHVRTVMAGGLTGAPTPVQEGQLATHDRGLLLVDATLDGPGLPNAPTDAQVDSFYAAQTTAWQVAGQWDRIDSLAVGVTLSDADLAPYGVALVYADYFTGNMAADTTALCKYRNNGGKLLLTGWRLSNVVMGSNAYAHHYGLGDFLYDLVGIDSIRVTTPPAQFIGTMGQAGYPDLVLDPAVYPSGLLFAESAWTDIFPPSVQVVGTFNSNQGAASPFHGKAVAWKEYSPQISWVLVDAPLFFMTYASAAAFLQHALTDLGAPPNAVIPGETSAPFAFHLYSPRPNPFNGMTDIRYQITDGRHVSLKVYDTGGRLVRTLVDGWRQPGNHIVNFDGKGLASGVYLIRLEAGRERATGKVVMVK